MPSTAHFKARRAQFLARIQNPVLLMAGGEVPRNYPANTCPYRPDSNFLFFFDQPEPDSAALFDPAARTVSLFLKTRTPEGELWHGSVPSFADMQELHAVDSVRPVEDLVDEVQKQAAGRPLHCK